MHQKVYYIGNALGCLIFMHNLKNIKIGNEIIHGRAILAPMSGVTDHIFRRIARRFGASLVVSEMVASDDFVRGSEESRLRAEGSGIDQHVVQIAGCEAHWMAEAARLAEATGAALIDINMGCPAKRVTGGYAGSALMRDLDHAERADGAIAAAFFPHGEADRAEHMSAGTDEHDRRAKFAHRQNENVDPRRQRDRRQKRHQHAAEHLSLTGAARLGRLF